MKKKIFCLVGVDNDFLDLIENKFFSFLGYFSKNNKFYNSLDKKKRLGEHNRLSWLKVKNKFNPLVIITIDDSKIRENLYKTIYKNNCKNFFYKNIFLSKSAKEFLKKEECIIIQKYAKIMPNVKIKTGVKININSQIHHDCLINEFATIAPNALLLGNVTVGKHAYIGANSTIKQNIKIGDGAIIGAGSVVIKDVKKNDIVVGIPAKSIKN